jgi:hypothetical protein
MWPSFGGQFLNATWHLISEIYVWLINLGLISHFNDHYTKPPIEPLMNTPSAQTPLKNKKKLEPNHLIAYSMFFLCH